MLTAVVSGSFHRHMGAITAAVHELAELSVRVLSPADPRVVAAQGEFLFVASDNVRSVRLVQDRHLECIRAANFLWLVCPDGYVGQSASMELGYAAAFGVPILGSQAPNDLTLRQYVNVVPSLEMAVNMVRARPRTESGAGILIDPHASVQAAHSILDHIGASLTRKAGSAARSRGLYEEVMRLRSMLTIPSFVQ